jgi:lysozyme family protein
VADVLANLTTALDDIIESEGPEVNRGPSEPGGISKYGVSLEAFADYCKSSARPVPTADDIANLTEADARLFYTNAFLNRIRFAELPSGVDYRLADIEVNLGPTGGITALQLALGIWPMGTIMTDAILGAVGTVDSRQLIRALGGVWISKKYTSASWSTYGHGWMNRDISSTQKAIAMVPP